MGERRIFDMKPREPVIRWPPLYQDAAELLDAMTAPDETEDDDESCGATDGAPLVDVNDPDALSEPYGRCTLPAGHQTGGGHQEWRGDTLWAEWRGPVPGERCGICGHDGAEH